MHISPDGFCGGKGLTRFPPAERAINQAQQDERLKYTVEEFLRKDGRMDWEVFVVEVNQGHVTLYGEVDVGDEKGLSTRISSTVP